MSLPKNAKEIVEFAKMGKIEDGVLIMPTLWAKRTTGKWGYWTIHIGIVGEELESGDIDRKDTDGDWMDDIEDWEPVNQEYIEREDLPEGYLGIYWSASGQEDGKETVTKPSFVTEGKSVGRANYTTPFTQAVRNAMTQYNSKVRKGQVTSDVKKFIKDPGETYTIEELMEATHRGDYPWRIHVMLLHDVNKAKNWRHVNYPCYVQAKINGTHFVVVHHPDLPEHTIKGDNVTIEDAHLDWYSRGREGFAAQDHVFAELYPSMVKRPGLHVSGELYIPGMHLQDLGGSARRIKSKDKKGPASKRKKAVKQKFYIFDVFYIDQPEMPFEERLAIIEEIFEEIDEREYPRKWCQPVPIYETDNKEELMGFYQSWLDEGYEGAVIRNKDSPYEVGVDKPIRSYTTLKLKPREDKEYPIIGYTDGKKGKGVGALIWICKTAGKKGKEFNVTPNWTDEVRYAAYEAFNENEEWFDTNIKNQLATISYSELSKEDKPQQPKFLQFRDAAVEDTLAEHIGIELR